MLIDGHGNFGSMDGDGAAAMRYTEARLSKISMEMLRDLEKETVKMTPNYEGEDLEPDVLPARMPNLLVNGSMGIAVGMATNVAPHNLGETIDAIIAQMHNPEITTTELMEYIKGPDFPTGGYIVGKSAIRKAFETGKGSIIMRGKTEIDRMPNGKGRIIITEIPYAVNKARKMPIFFVFFRHYCQNSCPGPHIYAKLWVLTHRFCVSAAAKRSDRRSESRSFSKQNFFKEVVPSFHSLCYNLFLATVLDRRTNPQRARQTL